MADASTFLSVSLCVVFSKYANQGHVIMDEYNFIIFRINVVVCKKSTILFKIQAVKSTVMNSIAITLNCSFYAVILHLSTKL